MAFDKPIAVAALDFGTTLSGWAFRFRQECEKDVSKIYAKNWNSGDNISPKTPTALLIRPDGETLEAFGYDAENKYITLASEDKHLDYYFFNKFKMMLYKQKVISRDMELEAEDGKKLPAMLIFRLAIGYLKDDILEEYENKIPGGLSATDIYWTLTVPAIWNERAKKFMREAAMRAGIDSNRLTLVLEPESASIFCQSLPLERSFGGHISSLAVGSTCAIIDCGGGTTDICCHRILENNKVEEIYRAEGGAVGGADVDKAFELFLIKICGSKVWHKFISNKMNVGELLSLRRSFELKKRKMAPEKGDPVTFSLPAELVNLLQTESGEDLQAALGTAGLLHSVKVLKGNKIKVNAEFLRESIYGDVVNRFQRLLSDIWSHEKVCKTEAILLVGGFSESRFIEDAVRNLIPDKQIVTVEEPSLAVVKGAVVYGLDESVVQTRIARHTYGEGFSKGFDANKHDKEKVWLDADGAKWVRVFEPIVLAGEVLPVDGEFSCESYVPMSEHQTYIRSTIIAINGETSLPTYIDDPRCIEIGQIIIPITNMKIPRNDREFVLKLKFGGTEIKATSTEIITGNSMEVDIDFLG